MSEDWSKEILEAGALASWKKDTVFAASAPPGYNPSAFHGATSKGEYVFCVVRFETKNLVGYDGTATVRKNGQVNIVHLTREVAEKLYKFAETNCQEK